MDESLDIVMATGLQHYVGSNHIIVCEGETISKTII